MRLIQHKKEAYWFYRFLSLGYDRWVNPLFWTPAMRAEALELARLDDAGLEVLDAGAGTGFTTEGIVARVPARQVTMLDQSPHQLARARAKPALTDCRKLLGDAEQLPFADDTFDRYVSAGSIEYWPDPQRGIAEAYRVTQAERHGAGHRARPPGATALARWLAEAWMLFPPAASTRAGCDAAGFDGRRAPRSSRPTGTATARGPYALAVSGVKPRARPVAARSSPGRPRTCTRA